MTVKCLGCGEDVPDNSVFCARCGRELTVAGIYCTRCGATNVMSAKYCSGCGHGFLPRRRSGFLTAAGVLTIIASCLALVIGFFGLYTAFWGNYEVAIFPGIAGLIGFGFGLASGIMILRRQLLSLVFIGQSVVLLASMLCLFRFDFFLVFGLAPLIIGILSVVFVAVSHRQFDDWDATSRQENQGLAMHQTQTTEHPRASGLQEGLYRPRINVVCLTGAILATLSLFLPWAIVNSEASGTNVYLGAFDFDEATPITHSLGDNLRYSLLIFMIGTLVAFFSPLGGIPQLMGSLGFVLATFYSSADMMFWTGAAVGIISSAAVFMSMVAPVGIGYSREREEGAAARLLTVSVFKH